MRRKILHLFFLTALSVHLYAQSDNHKKSIDISLDFNQGSWSIDSSSNPFSNGRLEEFTKQVNGIMRDQKVLKSSLQIISGTSPEGSSIINNSLSDKRNKQVKMYLLKSIPFKNINWNSTSLGIDWKGLTSLVEESDMDYKSEALNILYNTPEWIYKNGVIVDGRKLQLKTLRGGSVWKFMENNMFTKLRKVDVNFQYALDHNVNTEERPLETLLDVKQDSDDKIEDDLENNCNNDGNNQCNNKDNNLDHKSKDDCISNVQIDCNKPFYMAVKSNLLYDAGLVPNIGIEFYLGHQWSLGGSWVYAWWSKNSAHKYWRIYGGEIDLRKYFGKKAMEKPLSGHHIGVYGQIFTYDVEKGGRGNLGGKPGGNILDKYSYGLGLEYGYSFPIGRRLNLDCGLGIGYIGGEYREYIPVDGCYIWKSTKERNWFGPTKAEVSLIWLLGRGNYNQRKGGK